MEKCVKHATYKGLRKPKRDCPDCLRLYKQVRSAFTGKIRYGGRCYGSVTTPGSKMTSIELLSEISTCMLYGKLPIYFWRQNSAATRHFKSMIAKLNAWKKRDDLPFGLFDQFMFHIYTQFCQEKVASEIKRKIEVKQENNLEEIEDKDNINIDTTNMVSDKSRRRLMGLKALSRSLNEEVETTS